MNGEQVTMDENKAPANQEKVATVREKLVADPLEQLNSWDGKHPLNSSWSLWYSDRGIAREWTDCVKEVLPFDTVEDFWCLFNYLKPVSVLKIGCDFYLFKKGIRPMWEDPANKEGGRWDITVEKGYPPNRIDVYWMELVMLMVGGSFSDLGVNGVCVSRRERNGRISIWTSVADDREKLVFLGKSIKGILSIPQGQLIHFRAHADSAKPAGRQPNPLYSC